QRRELSQGALVVRGAHPELEARARGSVRPSTGAPPELDASGQQQVRQRLEIRSVVGAEDDGVVLGIGWLLRRRRSSGTLGRERLRGGTGPASAPPRAGGPGSRARPPP